MNWYYWSVITNSCWHYRLALIWTRLWRNCSNNWKIWTTELKMKYVNVRSNTNWPQSLRNVLTIWQLKWKNFEVMLNRYMLYSTLWCSFPFSLLVSTTVQISWCRTNWGSGSFDWVAVTKGESSNEQEESRAAAVITTRRVRRNGRRESWQCWKTA